MKVDYDIVSMTKRLEGISKDYTILTKEGLELSYSIKTTELTKDCKCNEVIAFDTETFEGNCKLICVNSLNSDGYSLPLKITNIIDPSFDDCIRMLTYHINNTGVYRFFWNIDFDIQAILKLYDKDDKLKFIDNLSKGIPMRFIDYRGVEYEFKWIRSKLFTIKQIKKKKSVVFTDLYSFYNLGLGLAGSKYIGKTKKDIIDAEKLNTDINYWKHKYDIIDYCLQDSYLTAKLGLYLINSILNEGLRLPKYLVSPASISKANYRYKNRIPNLSHTPIEIVQIGYNCYFGGRFEVFKRGFFNEGFLYDVVSEYPDYLRKLPDMFNGRWIRLKGKIKLPENQPLLAFYKAKLDIPFDNEISTIPFKNKAGLVCFPNGIIEKWLTWFDLDLMRDYIIEITDGYEYVKPSIRYIEKTKRDITYPFKAKTDELFCRKKHIVKEQYPMNYNTVKITLNGIYGCTIEIHENIYLDNKGNEYKELKGGVLFNPIYASHITAYGRWKLFKDIPKDKWINILAVHTDSVITDVNLDDYLDIGSSLGQWNLEGKGKTIILNTGMYQVGNIVKTRGIPKKFIGNWLRFCLKNNQLDKKTFLIRHMKKVREAIIQDKDVINMNTMTDIERSVNINSDTKRSWFRLFTNFKNLLNNNINSLPLFIKDNELNPNPLVLAEKLGMPKEIVMMIIDGKDDLF